MDDSSPMCGPAGIDFDPDLTFHAKARELRGAMAEALVAPVTIDCVRPQEHAAHHTPADEHGRRICCLCHPPG